MFVNQINVVVVVLHLIAPSRAAVRGLSPHEDQQRDQGLFSGHLVASLISNPLCDCVHDIDGASIACLLV